NAPPVRYTPATQLTAAPGTLTVGAVVDLTVTVTAQGTTTAPTGSVDFVDTTTGIDLGTATLSDGTASLSTADLAVGSHTIDARYRGAGSFNASDGTTSVSVNAAPVPDPGPPPVPPVDPTPLAPTDTTVSSQPLPGTAHSYIIT